MTSVLHRVRVAEKISLARDVVGLTLVSDDEQLPSWSPGAHIDVVLPSGTVRQYSLCGTPDEAVYRIAVLREPMGRGGSEEVHDAVEVGSVLRIGPPRNRFPLESAEEYVFIAGGIGITPILPMIEEVERAGRRWVLHYGGRSLGSMAYLDRLADYAERVAIRPQDTDGVLNVAAILEAARQASVYVCGPPGLIDAVQTTAEDMGLGAVHFERFNQSPPMSDVTDEPGESFEVQLGIDGPVLTVQPGTSILDTILDSGVDVLFSCQEGSCGSCQTSVIAGEPDHRDQLLTEEERAQGDMLICISRSRSPRLVLRIEP